MCRFSACRAFLILVLCAVATQAATYHGLRCTYRQPDQTPFIVLLWGDDYSVDTEDERGWAVLQDAQGWWCYAIPDGLGGLRPSAIRVGAGDPSTLGVAQHLRLGAAQRTAIRQALQARRGVDAVGRPDTDFHRQRRARNQARLSAHWAASAQARAVGKAMPSPPSLTTTGQLNGVTLLVGFPDFPQYPTMLPRTKVDAVINGASDPYFGNAFSVKGFFQHVSLGRLTYTTTVIDYYTAEKDRDWYTDPANDGAETLIAEALDALAASGFNFATVDLNGDKNIDSVNVLYASDIVNNWAEGLWPHMNPSFRWTSPSGYKAVGYEITATGDEDPGTPPDTFKIGTFCHENGHLICDFPDLYDYDGDSQGAGSFCLMGSGSFPESNPNDVGGYLALAAGWRDPVDITSADVGELELYRASDSQPEILRMRKPGSITEYFLFENRSGNRAVRLATGLDSFQTTEGMAIWHCDAYGDNSSQNYTRGNNHMHYEGAVVQADNQRHLERNTNRGDIYDLWSQSNLSPYYTGRFEDQLPYLATANDAHWWDGSASGLVLYGISAPANPMTFTLGNINVDVRDTSLVMTEGSALSTMAVVVERTGSAGGAVSVGWQLVDGSATAGSDYVAANGVLNWGSGDMSAKTVTISINGDSVVEPDETFTFELQLASLSPSTANVTRNACAISILDDDTPRVRLATAALALDESRGAAQLIVYRTGVLSSATSVAYTTSAGTATMGLDFTFAAGTITWQPNDGAPKIINVPVVADEAWENPETFSFVLSSPVGATVATPGSCLVTLSDAPPRNLLLNGGTNSGGGSGGGGCGGGSGIAGLLGLLPLALMRRRR